MAQANQDGSEGGGGMEKEKADKQAEKETKEKDRERRGDVDRKDKPEEKPKQPKPPKGPSAKEIAAAAAKAEKERKAAERKAMMDKFMADLNVAVQRTTAMADTAVANWQQAVQNRTAVFDKYDTERVAWKTKQGTQDQMAALAQMKDMSQGNGPSAAQAMLAAESAKAQRAQLAQATARGGANISAIRGAGMAAAAQQGDIAGQAAAVRAQEQQAALQAYAAQANEIERQRMSGENMYLNAAMQGLQLGNQYALASGEQAAAMGQQDFSQRYTAGMVPIQDVLTKEQMDFQQKLAKIQADSAMGLQKQAQGYQDSNRVWDLFSGMLQAGTGAAAKMYMGK